MTTPQTVHRQNFSCQPYLNSILNVTFCILPIFQIIEIQRCHPHLSSGVPRQHLESRLSSYLPLIPSTKSSWSLLNCPAGAFILTEQYGRWDEHLLTSTPLVTDSSRPPLFAQNDATVPVSWALYILFSFSNRNPSTSTNNATNPNISLIEQYNIQLAAPEKAF